MAFAPRYVLMAATAALVPSLAQAGSADAYTNGAAPAVPTGFSALAPVADPYVAPLVAAPAAVAPVSVAVPDDAGIGACSGMIDGERCLVILNDHMRRVPLGRAAGTIMVGNPTIADVTVLGSDMMFVSARSIGSTNIIALDQQGHEIATFTVFVREPRIKRVVLREAGIASNYQCAPQCERALAQSDSPEAYGAASGQVSADIGLDQTAIGLQSGANPNTDPSALGAAAASGGGASAGAANGDAMGASNRDMSGSLGNGANAVSALMGGGGAPAKTSAPPANTPPASVRPN